MLEGALRPIADWQQVGFRYSTDRRTRKDGDKVVTWEGYKLYHGKTSVGCYSSSTFEESHMRVLQQLVQQGVSIAEMQQFRMFFNDFHDSQAANIMFTSQLFNY